MYKQILIARKDLDMSPGKLSAQISHASMSFITHMIRNHVINNSPITTKQSYTVESFEIEKDLYEQWICLLYTSPSPRDRTRSRMPSSA